MAVLEYIKKIIRIYNTGSIRVSEQARKHPVVAAMLVGPVKLKDKLKNGGKIDKELDEIIHTFRPDAKPKACAKLKKDIWRSRELHLIDPDEYFLYGFDRLSDTERHAFVGNREKELLCRQLNRNDAWMLFTDKWQTYQKFFRWYHRDVMHISTEADLVVFQEFLQKHGRVIVKAATASQGKGIFAAEAKKSEEAMTDIAKLLTKGTAVAESCIVQDERFARFNPSSVNTVRIATFRTDEQVEILFAFMRTGRSGAVVDNGGSGGMLICIDPTTGECITDGCDERGNRYELHPDSQERFQGFRIPDWEGAIATAKELAMVVPEQRYVGWDLAYTRDGWVMVEGNSWSQFVGPQITRRVGMRSEVERAFCKYI